MNGIWKEPGWVQDDNYLITGVIIVLKILM